jgi:hypothetical protein
MRLLRLYHKIVSLAMQRASAHAKDLEISASRSHQDLPLPKGGLDGSVRFAHKWPVTLSGDRVCDSVCGGSEAHWTRD